jgi:uncharacterized damage-inducible protein DinB
MDKKDIKLLFAYNRWANGQTLDSVSALTAQQLDKNLATSHNSVHGTLTHILAAEWIWLMRCKGVSPKSLFDPSDFSSLASLREKWVEVEQGQRGLIDELNEENLAKRIHYTNIKGEQWEYRLERILQHVVNHSSYHRGQITTMLRQLGAEAVMTDFLAYIDVEPEGV